MFGKVITKYVKVDPYGQIAFLRSDSYIREGTSKSAPVVTDTLITNKTVLTIVERRNNWLKVQIDLEDSCLYGWIEESKIIKFKKMKD